MNKHTATFLGVSVFILMCAGILHIALPVAQPLLNEGIALGEPLNEVFVVNVVDGDMQMLVALN